jgi:hypothetical protein
MRINGAIPHARYHAVDLGGEKALQAMQPINSGVSLEVCVMSTQQIAQKPRCQGRTLLMP